MDLTHDRERAAEVRRRYDATIKRLREDSDLTPEARNRRMAEEWAKARKELDGLQAAERTRLAERETLLERRLFGADSVQDSSQAISSRDAQDRAGRLTDPREAAQLLARAEANGDEALAKAVAYHAINQSRGIPRAMAAPWEDVAGMYLNARPQLSDTVEELASIERLTTRQILNEFSLTQPPGVSSADINAAQDAGDNNSWFAEANG